MLTQNQLKERRFVPNDCTLEMSNDYCAVYYTPSDTASKYPAAIGYIGQSCKRTFYKGFRCSLTSSRKDDFEFMLKYIVDFTTRVTANSRQREAEKEARKRKNAEFDVAKYLKVGDVLYFHYGWEANLYTYWQITSMTRKTVTVAQVASHKVGEQTFTSWKQVAVPGDFVVGDKGRVEQTLHVRAGGSSDWYIHADGTYSYWGKWDGRPDDCDDQD